MSVGFDTECEQGLPKETDSENSFSWQEISEWRNFKNLADGISFWLPSFSMELLCISS